MNTAHLSSTKNTSPLAAFADQQIDWNLTPEMAVTLYLEWGNNDWRSDGPFQERRSHLFCRGRVAGPFEGTACAPQFRIGGRSGDCSAAGAAGESVPGRVRFPQGGL